MLCNNKTINYLDITLKDDENDLFDNNNYNYFFVLENDEIIN